MGKRVRSILSLLVLAVLAVAAGVYIRFYLQDAGRMPMPPEFEDRLRQGNGAVEGLRTLAEARAMLKDAPDEAAQRLRALIAAAPSSPEAFEARLILAELLAKGGDAPGAIRLLDDVIAGQAGPRRTRAHIERAKILGKTDPAAARRDLQEVLGNDEHLPALQLKARLELGLLDLEAGDYLRAIATLSPLTARDYPEKPAALEGVRKAVEGHAQKLAAGNDPAALLAWGEEMVKRFPELDAMRSTIRYHQAAALRQAGRLTDARRLAERLRRDAPELQKACTDELARLTEAEAAKGIARGAAAFLKAAADGKENRAHLEGDLAADTAWTKARSPLVLTGTTTVKRGATLTIEAGCTVQFLLGARLVVEGALLAAGTPEAPIRFTSAVANDPTPFDGEGILFADSSDDERCRLEHCIVEYQRVGVACAAASPVLRRCVLARNGTAGLHATDGAAPRLEDLCRIENNDAAGLRAEGANVALRGGLVLKNGADGLRLTDKSQGTIEGNRIRDNAGHGIACDSFSSPAIRGNEIAGNHGCGIRCNRFSQPAIQGNLIRDNRGPGIRCSLDSASTIAANLIEGNGDHPIILEKSDGVIQGNLILRNRPYGVDCRQSASPRIEGNWIEGNGGAAILCGEGSAPTITGNAILGHKLAINIATTLTVQAAGNYFGDVDDAHLAEQIIDKADVTGLGEVVWKPRLTAPPTRPATPTPDLPPLPQ